MDLNFPLFVGTKKGKMKINSPISGSCCCCGCGCAGGWLWSPSTVVTDGTAPRTTSKSRGGVIRFRGFGSGFPFETLFPLEAVMASVSDCDQ
jgi:hypothetical protein